MFGIGKQEKVITPEFIEARAYYGMAIHVIPGEGGRERKALCGYTEWTPTNTVIPVTSETILSSVANQHSGWFWCQSCAAQLTGLPMDAFKML